MPVKFLLFLTLITSTLALVPSLPAQEGQDQDQPEKRDVRAERLKSSQRGMPIQGFGGLKPAEARAAQTLFDKALKYEAAKNFSAAMGSYKRIYKRYPRSTVAPEAYAHSAGILVQQGKLTKAFDMLDAVVRAYPNYGHFNELISEQYRIAYELTSGYRRKFLGFLPGFAHREKGVEFFERMIRNAPYSDYAPLALINVAETEFRAGEPEIAIDALDRLITNYPNSVVTSDAYLRLAQIHEKLVDGPLYDQTSTHDSMNNYEDFLILFPKDPNVGKAEAGLVRMKEVLAESRVKMADFYYYKRSRYQAAKVFYNEAITIAPNSTAAQAARERLALVEVDEARAAARLAADAGKQKKKGVFDFFKPSTVQAPTPIGVTAEPPKPALSTPAPVNPGSPSRKP